jgi:rhodanese-related sulfurtransferase
MYYWLTSECEITHSQPPTKATSKDPSQTMPSAAIALAQPAPSFAGAVAEADPATVRQWLDDGEALLVDVREPDEYAMERIPGSLLLPKSLLDAAAFPRVPGMKVVLVCYLGRRSITVGEQLLAAGYTQAISLKGGILAWSAAGFQTEVAAEAA